MTEPAGSAAKKPLRCLFAFNPFSLHLSDFVETETADYDIIKLFLYMYF